MVTVHTVCSLASSSICSTHAYGVEHGEDQLPVRLVGIVLGNLGNLGGFGRIWADLGVQDSWGKNSGKRSYSTPHRVY